MNDLDEIEMELGKESMKYVCDHAGACERKPCYHEGKHEAVKACDPPRSGLKGCDHLHSKCIPVEPERVRTAVQAYLCTNRECGWNEGGVCGSIWWRNNGCDLRVLPQVPSPGLLQRMGMLTWKYEQQHWLILAGTPDNLVLDNELWGVDEDYAEREAESVGGKAVLWDEGED